MPADKWTLIPKRPLCFILVLKLELKFLCDFPIATREDAHSLRDPILRFPGNMSIEQGDKDEKKVNIYKLA